MPFRIDNAIVLFGLFALAIPVVLHLLQRRRFDTLDWGAMQFLPDSIVSQRRRWLDEILLMLLRMAMIALIVFALATPISTGLWLGPFSDHSTRDIVLVIDGSYSMDVRAPGQATPWDDALRRLREHIENAPPSDRFSILVARDAPAFLREEFAHELVDEISITPNANPDMPQTLAVAWKHLQARGKAATKEIVVLTDGQRHGWADPAALSALDHLGNQWNADADRAKSEGSAIPSLRVVTVGGALPKPLANFSLAPLTASRTVIKVGQKATFRSAFVLEHMAKHLQTMSIIVRIDGVETQKLALPEQIDLKKGQIPLAFQHRFDKVGPQIVSLRIDADDALLGDNEQIVAVDVVKELTILCVDGDETLSAESSSFFLQKALGAQAVPYAALKAADFSNAVVLVLADVPRLSPTHLDAIERFLDSGGGVLVVAGERAAKEKAFYNERLYRGGDGWLPAMLSEVGQSKNGAQPDVRSFQHPALELFRAAGDGVLKDVRFPKWTKTQLGLKDRATVMATFNNGDPFLIEKTHGKGRVILCSVPLDRSWNSTLPSTWEFPILMHELAYYLAGNRAANGRLPMDLRESDLTRCSDDDWRKVRDRLPVTWRDDDADASLGTAEAAREELWWLLLVAVVGLLCMEVWMTRRMALARG